MKDEYPTESERDRFAPEPRPARRAAKDAGFKFRGEKDGGPLWFTTDPAIAKACAQFATQSALDVLRQLQTERKAAMEASRATDADINVPVPDGLEYLPFQRAGIAFAQRDPKRGVLMGDEMGLESIRRHPTRLASVRSLYCGGA